MADDAVSQQFLTANKGGNLTSEQINIAFQDMYGVNAPGNIIGDFAGKVGGQDAHFLEKVRRGDFGAELRQKSPGFFEQSATARALKMQQDAARPYVESLRGGIPELSQKYDVERERLSGEKETLSDRYSALIDKIKGVSSRRETETSKVKSAELGRRGLLTSGTGQTELLRTLDPIRQELQEQMGSIGVEKEAGLQNIENLLAGLVPQETSDIRSIKNAIAQLQYGATQTGISQGLTSYQQKISNALEQSRWDVDKRIKEAELKEYEDGTPETPEYKYASGAGGYLYNPFDPTDITKLAKLTGGVGTGTTTSTNYYSTPSSTNVMSGKYAGWIIDQGQ